MLTVEASERKYTEKIYKPHIRSVLLYAGGDEGQAPVIQLNQGNYLTLKFDDLQDNLADYSYRIIHCGPYWRASNISEFKYLEGFNENYIDDFQFSINTLVPYVHYSLKFPNKNIGLKISGNYVIQVYEDYDTENIIFEKRFFVVDPGLQIYGNVRNCSNIRLMKTHHEVNFMIKYDQDEISNPLANIKVFITQNDRFDSIIREVKPQFLRKQEMVFEYRNDVEKTAFRAGLEFRYFNIINLNLTSPEVDEIYQEREINHIRLYPDKVREKMKLLYENDLNGGFFIDVKNKRDRHLESDYVWIGFTLLYDFELTNQKVYVVGKFNDWQYNENNRMYYNEALKAYTLSFLLKQGFYNYEYVSVNQHGIHNPGLFEGSDSVTENTYSVFVYHYNLSNYYELIGWKTFYSKG